MTLIGSKLVQEDPSYVNIVKDFVNSLSERLSTMEEALDKEDFPVLLHAAHKLKAHGGGYGYSELFDLGQRLEAPAFAENPNTCDRLLEEFRELIKRIVVSV